MADTTRTSDPNWEAFVAYRKKYRRRVPKASWVAVRNAEILGVFKTFAECDQKLVSTRKDGEPIGCIYRGSSEPLKLTIFSVMQR
jgi:hypothetical protein